MSKVRYQARRFCKGDNVWTNWQECTEVKFKERAADPSFEVRTVAEYSNRSISLPELIRSTRKERGMTLEELADYAGTSKSYIWELEHGRVHNPGLRLCAAISDVLELPLGDMANSINMRQPAEEGGKS